MSTALLFITDGRKRYAEHTLASLQVLIDEGALRFDYAVVVDDACDDPSYGEWLTDVFPWNLRLMPIGKKRGFGGAINAGWEVVRKLDVDYVFHLEDDFVFTRYFRIEQLERILREHPELAQLALKRQPWNPTEEAAGDLIRVNWDSYEQHANDRGDEWYTHRLFFTSNPSLYPARIMANGWPLVERSEGVFSAELFRDPLVRCAYLGRKDDAPWVTHIGGVAGVSDRTGVVY